MIHKATESEVEFILSKAVDSANEGMKKENVVTQEQARSLLEMVLDSGASYRVIRNNYQVLMGWVLIGVQVDYITGEEFGFIYDLYVLPKFRGKGLSYRLINESLKELKEDGYREVRLNVFAGNFAKSIYCDLGFREHQTLLSKQL